MNFRRVQRRYRIGWQRRLTVAAALLAYLVSAVGVPMPIYVKRDSSTPFPCQHHACGCATAAQCWEDCCCYSPEQKLAWAHNNHVQPPERLVAQVAAIHASPSQHSAKPTGQCCAHRKVATESVACEHDHAGCDHSHGGHPSCQGGDESTGEVTLVIASLARGCRGLATSWCTSGAVMPPAFDIVWQFESGIVEWVALDTGWLLSGLRAVPVPPPRV